MKPIIVFTNGCFDILHVGHIRFLAEARLMGHLLCVGLNSDSSVRRLKGTRRPRLPAMLRREMLMALKSVDCVYTFEEDDPEKLIREVRPDILVKGEEWKAMGAVGAEFVRSYGGRVVFVKRTIEISTTKLLGGK